MNQLQRATRNVFTSHLSSQRMQKLLVFCPEERTLLLGGFTTRNILAQDGKITAVLDLIDASYGDVVYDIVALDFWWPPPGIREAFLAYQRQRGRDLPFYAERLLCYECHHALIGLRRSLVPLSNLFSHLSTL